MKVASIRFRFGYVMAVVYFATAAHTLWKGNPFVAMLLAVIGLLIVMNEIQQALTRRWRTLAESAVPLMQSLMDENKNLRDRLANALTKETP